MTQRRLLVWGLALAAVAALSVWTIDRAIALALQPFAADNGAMLHPIVSAIEIVFAFPISKFATGLALVAAALVMFAVARWRPAAWLVLFVGVSHLVTRLIAGVLKNVFLRARPDEALASADRFFVSGGSSFPSGHAAHFWALFFALAVAFPKLRIPALVLALFVSVARVAVNDHYVSDVIASAAIAAFVTAGCSLVILGRRRARLRAG